MRKLQDNPLDQEAIKLMYNTQKDVSTENRLDECCDSAVMFRYRCRHGLIQNLYLDNLLVVPVLIFFQPVN